MHHAFSTRAVHAGRKDLHRLGVHAPPIDLSSTYPIPDLSEAAASLAAMAEGRPPLGNPVYARLHNPTTARFEQGLAELEGAGEAVAFASGMAAVSACLLAARQRGDHVLAIRPLYGGTDHLLASELLGLQVDFVSPDELAAALRPTTALVILETPGNPTLDLVDIAAVVEIAGQVPVLVDSTFATPVLQQPLALGARLVLHSGTKAIGGHSDLMIGLTVTADDEVYDRLHHARLVNGSTPGALEAFLALRGVRTLPLRMERMQANAADLATHLAAHPAVAEVRYPGFGAMVSFVMVGGAAAADAACRAVRLIVPATSLGGVETTMERRQKYAGDAHVPPGLVRMSVGIEHVDDLWADLGAALDRAAAAG